MDSVIHIRRAGPEDARLIAEMSRRSFYDSFAAENTPEDMEQFLSGPFSLQKLVAEVESGDGLFLLAYHAGEPAGYARMRESAAPAAIGYIAPIEIARIYCEKSFIGKGIGKTLMQACLDLALEMKKDGVWLGVWERNLRAIAFYQKWGFEKFGDHIFVVGSDPQTDWYLKRKTIC